MDIDEDDEGPPRPREAFAEDDTINNEALDLDGRLKDARDSSKDSVQEAQSGRMRLGLPYTCTSKYTLWLVSP
jgi:hypothetical protein